MLQFNFGSCVSAYVWSMRECGVCVQEIKLNWVFSVNFANTWLRVNSHGVIRQTINRWNVNMQSLQCRHPNCELRCSPTERDLYLSNIWIIERQNHPNHKVNLNRKYNFKGFISLLLSASILLLQHVKDSRTETDVISVLNRWVRLIEVHVAFPTFFFW